MKTVYLSGPMTGMPEDNFPAFFEAAKRWREKGWRVISPAEEDIRLGGPLEHPTDVIIRRDLEIIMSLRVGQDAVVALAGWFASLGARAEVALAQWRGIQVICEGPVLIGGGDVV